MQVENKYHIFLDYRGYMVEPRASRILPAPLLGNKFSTGVSNYADLDFWQSAAMTNFTHGLNQKFMSDTNAYWFSTGIDVSIPGEFCLEKDLLSDSAFSVDPVLKVTYGTVSATYKTIDKLWAGTSTGYVFYRGITANSWTLETNITSDGNPVTGFFEIVDQNSAYDKTMYVCKGDYKGWIMLNSVWMQIAPIVQWAPTTTIVEGKKLGTTGSLTVRKIAQSILLSSNQTAKQISLLYRTMGGWTGDVTVNIFMSDPKTGMIATDSILETFDITLPNQATTFAWIDYNLSTDNEFVFSRCDKYFIEIIPKTTATDTSCPEFGCTIGNDSFYEGDTLIQVISGATDYSFATKGEQMSFKLWSDLPVGVDLVSSQGFNAFGWVDNGIKSTSNGVLWTPDSSKGLWTLPASQGTAKALGRTSRGTVVGGSSSLWLFVGGSSALNLWDFPDYIDANNFKGFCEWNNRILFSVENQGLFMTDGSAVGQSNINKEREAFKFKSCAGITTCGWDAFAICKNTADEWYLLRSNSYYDGSFIYWWAVKKLTKTPVKIASLNIDDVIVFYSDYTEEMYSKDGVYQSTGYLETSLFDAGLIKLDKLYNNIEAMFEPFETGTSCQLSYRTSLTGTYTNSEVFTTATNNGVLYRLFNPTTGNRFQVKITLNSDATHLKTSKCSDLVWSYILERSANEKNTLKTFYHTIICETSLENNTGDVEFMDEDDARKREDIVSDIWALAERREVLNYIGVDNISSPTFKLAYAGTHTYLLTIDRTNYTLNIIEGAAVVHSYNYYNKTTANIVTDLDELTIGADTEKIYCDLVNPFAGTESVNMLEPILSQTISTEMYLNTGTDVRAVIINPQSPSQAKMVLDGYGSDRIQINLREAN